MADNKIIDTKFHYNGVDYSIFAKWKNVENDSEDDVVVKKILDDKTVSIYNRDTKSYIVASIDRLILHPFGEKGGGRGRSGRFKFDPAGASSSIQCSGWTLYYKEIAGKHVNKLVKDKDTAPNKGDWEAIKGDILTSVGLKWNKSDQTFEKWGAALTTQQELDLCAVLKKYYTGAAPEQKKEGLTLKQIKALKVGEAFTEKNAKGVLVIKTIDEDGILVDALRFDGSKILDDSIYYSYKMLGEKINEGVVFEKADAPPSTLHQMEMTIEDFKALKEGDSFTDRNNRFVVQFPAPNGTGVNVRIFDDKNFMIQDTTYYGYGFYEDRMGKGVVYYKLTTSPKPKETPDQDGLIELFKTFETPQQLQAFNGGKLAEYKLNALSQIEVMLEGLEASKRDTDFISKQLPNRIWFVNPITGEPFQPLINKGKEFKRADFGFCLNTILSLGGIYIPIQEDISLGMAVHVDGEVNYEETKEEKKKENEEGGENYGEEDLRAGGLLKKLPWYALNIAIQISRNFINNTFTASFKYPEFTDEFKKVLNEIEVEYEEKNYKGDMDTITAPCYYKDFGDGKWMYILHNGGYAAMNCNDFLIGYNFMSSMVSKDGYLMDYVKDVDGFNESLMNATRPYPQLLEKYPQIFGQRKPEPEPQPEPPVVVEKTYSIEQDIADLELLLSLESDPIEYAKMKRELDDVLFLKSLQ